MAKKAESESVKALKRAKDHLIPILKSLNIATVTIDYDGEGDSGQIENIACYDAATNDVASKLNETVTSAGEDKSQSLESAIEYFAWDFLSFYHAGFEDNDGGFGTITIDVAKGTARMEHNDRFVDFTTSKQEV